MTKKICLLHTCSIYAQILEFRTIILALPFTLVLLEDFTHPTWLKKEANFTRMDVEFQLPRHLLLPLKLSFFLRPKLSGLIGLGKLIPPLFVLIRWWGYPYFSSFYLISFTTTLKSTYFLLCFKFCMPL